jgi:hypothetical protein
LVVSADGEGVVSHAGSRLLADPAERSTLTGELTDALGRLARPRTAHDPGRVLVDLAVAVAVAVGAECISDVAVLADQPGLFEPVASDSTVWRLLAQLGEPELVAVAQARAAAREVVWAQRAEVTGAAVSAAVAAGVELPGLVIDVDASIVECHSEKESAAATFKSSFGYHPILAFCDNSGEFLAGLLRPGNAGANTAADHISVLDQALTQMPDAHRHGVAVLIRADGAGCSKAFLAHIRGLRAQAVLTEFSVGWAVTDRERAAIDTLPTTAWTDAIDADGQPRAGAHIAELTGLLPPRTLAGYPAGTRVLVCRERPHPGAQLDAFRRTRRLAPPMLRHRHPSRTTGVPRRPPPRPRPRGRPDPDRQRHRPGPLPHPNLRHQRGLADRGHARPRPHLLGSDNPPARRPDPGQGRAEDAALPTPARRRPYRPRRTAAAAAPRSALALGDRPTRRVRPLPRATPTRPLNPAPRPDDRSRRTRHTQAGRPGTSTAEPQHTRSTSELRNHT